MCKDDNTTTRQQVYLEHRRELVVGEMEQARSYDKHILTLASGGLALSVVFLQHVAPNPVCWTFTFIILAWLAMTLCILSTLLSFLLSQAAYRQARDDADEAMRTLEGHEPPVKPNLCSTWTNRLNWCSMIFFVSGVISFLIFAAGNLKLSAP